MINDTLNGTQKSLVLLKAELHKVRQICAAILAFVGDSESSVVKNLEKELQKIDESVKNI